MTQYYNCMTNRTVTASKLLMAGGVSVASVLVSSVLMRRGMAPGPARLAAALLPVPFFLVFIAAELRWLRESDEFHRAVILESLAMAFPGGIVLAVLVEALQKAGFLAGWGIGELWPWMALLWLPALWLAHRRFL